MMLFRLPAGRHGRRRRTAFLGAGLGMASTLAILAFRVLLPGDPGPGAFLGELKSFPTLYIAALAVTVTVFSFFGYRLGRTVDALEKKLADAEKAAQELKRASQTDGLTGAYTRRHLTERLEEAFANAKRSGRPLACLFVDVDNLKVLNDHRGHRTGDDALILVSAALRAQLRRGDILGRYGGDEFVAILPDADAQAAKICAERVRAEVSLMELPTQRGPVGLSVSIGVHAPTHLPATHTAFLQAADEALRQSKKEGRNKVILTEASVR
jgi:diguanylate cyclase (GGDEF)-like protein